MSPDAQQACAGLKIYKTQEQNLTKAEYEATKRLDFLVLIINPNHHWHGPISTTKRSRPVA